MENCQSMQTVISMFIFFLVIVKAVSGILLHEISSGPAIWKVTMNSLKNR